jgi:UDP-N-acetyl-D-mannosaminuronic acid dehydrogenase
MSFNTISVIGLGYIGLPTAAMFASKGKKVIGVDVSQHAVDTINSGKIHIVEPKLDVMVKKAVDGGFLKATIYPEPADAFLIAVPTPFLSIDSCDTIPQPDLSYIEAATRSVAKVLKQGDLVILESTSPVGATEQMAAWLAEERRDLSFPQTHGEKSDIRVAHCPERVLPGYVVQELVTNDRVIGGMTARCSAAAINLYRIFVEGECVVTNSRTAEMAKLTENASRDVNIAFANELSILCDRLDINVWELIELANRHPRVNILQPGPGVGGHCIAVDPWFIASQSPNEAKLITTARRVNDGKPAWVVNKVMTIVENIIAVGPASSQEEISIVCYGLTFKPNIDDLRQSPALTIVESLISQSKLKVYVVEPNIAVLPKTLIDDCELISYEKSVTMTADISLVLVAHDQFKNLVAALKGKMLFNTVSI